MKLYAKTIKMILLLAISFALPLAGAPILLLDPRVILLMIAGAIMLLTQPDFSVSESKQHDSTDRKSVLYILITGLLSQVVPVIEWAYFGAGATGEYSVAFIAIGTIMVVAGLALRVWSIRTLGKFFTATVRLVNGHRLIRSGPYNIVRHPSYTGAYVSLIGSSVLLQAPIGFILGSILMALAYYVRLQAEEAMLKEAFGQEYRDYQASTPALIPGKRLLSRRYAAPQSRLTTKTVRPIRREGHGSSCGGQAVALPPNYQSVSVAKAHTKSKEDEL